MADSVVAGAGIALAATAFIEARGSYWHQLYNETGVVLLLASTPYLVSAIYGLTTVAGCRAPKHREDDARTTSHR